jgi:ubiquinone/menaquinone biosynthesis C-methylase UbiE
MEKVRRAPWQDAKKKDSGLPAGEILRPDAELNAARREFSLILAGYACFETLYSATKFDLFTILDSHPGLAEPAIRKKLGLKAQPARILLNSCRALRLIRLEDGGYFNSPMAANLLNGNNPKNIIKTVNVYHELIYLPMHRLHESLRKGTNGGLGVFPGKGKTLYDRLASRPRLERVFHDWMNNLGSEVDVGQACFPHISPVLGRMRHIIDVGGGDGSNAAILCRLFPHLRVTVFDLASIGAKAKKNLRGSPFKDRIDFVRGDFLRDPFPSGADGIFFSHVFNIYSAKKNTAILKKCHRYLPKGGSVIVYNSADAGMEEHAVSAAHLSLYFMALATGEGMVYSLKDYDQWFSAAGFPSPRKTYLPGLMKAIVVGTKAK